MTTYSPLGTPDPNSVTLQPNVPVEVPPPTKDPLVQQIAEKHGKHVAQVHVPLACHLTLTTAVPTLLSCAGNLVSQPALRSFTLAIYAR